MLKGFIKGSIALSLLVMTIPSTIQIANASNQENLAEERSKNFGYETMRIEDVSLKDWYAQAIKYVMGYDLMGYEGIGENYVYFKPEELVSRQEIADILYRATKMIYPILADGKQGLTTYARNMFDYGEIDGEYLDGVQFCMALNVIKGDDRHYLHPRDNVDREEFATIMTRYMKMLSYYNMVEELIDEEVITMGKKYTDQSDISEWAINSIEFCRVNGLMNGGTDNLFRPKGKVTRAQMAQAIYNIMPDKNK